MSDYFTIYKKYAEGCRIHVCPMAFFFLTFQILVLKYSCINNYIIYDKGVFYPMKRGSFFKNHPFHREGKWKGYESGDWEADVRRGEIREVSKENPYSYRGIPLQEYGCKFVKIGYFSKSGLKRWVLSKDCCNSHSLILAS